VIVLEDRAFIDIQRHGLPPGHADDTTRERVRRVFLQVRGETVAPVLEFLLDAGDIAALRPDAEGTATPGRLQNLGKEQQL
jgi:hypothetical protein